MNLNLFIILIVLLIYSYLSVYFFNKFFLNKRIIDKVIHRSSHSSIATRSGGFTIFFVISTITIYLYILNNQIFDFSILIPLGILFLIGLYDDIYNSDFKLKFIFQLIAAKIMIDQGIYIENLNGLFGIYEIPYILSQPLTIIFIVTVINSFNFTDGIDGLALFEFFKFSLLILYFEGSLLSGYNFLLLACLPVAVILLFFNFKKDNKVFLGDGGSLFLGGLIAVLIISFINAPQSNDYNTLTSIFILYLYPIVDLFRVIIIRVKNKNSPFEADKNHIHHYFLNLGYNHLKTSLIVCFSSLLIQLLIILVTS